MFLRFNKGAGARRSQGGWGVHLRAQQQGGRVGGGGSGPLPETCSSSEARGGSRWGLDPSPTCSSSEQRGVLPQRFPSTPPCNTPKTPEKTIKTVKIFATHAAAGGGSGVPSDVPPSLGAGSTPGWLGV